MINAKKTLKIKENLMIMAKLMEKGCLIEDMEKATDFTKASVLSYRLKMSDMGIGIRIETVTGKTRGLKRYTLVTPIKKTYEILEDLYGNKATCELCGEEKELDRFKVDNNVRTDTCLTCYVELCKKEGMVCISCNILKPYHSFYGNKTRPSQKSGTCKACEHKDVTTHNEQKGNGLESWLIQTSERRSSYQNIETQRVAESKYTLKGTGIITERDCQKV